MGYAMKLLERVERTETEAGCASYGPGHQLHWTHWKQAATAPAIYVTRVRMEGDVVELLLPGEPIRWRHHDADRLRAALTNARQPIAAVPEHQMLRVDGYWFNCASVDAEFTLCG
jgi:hypothetical protein